MAPAIRSAEAQIFYEKHEQKNAFLSDASQPAGKKQSLVRGYDV